MYFELFQKVLETVKRLWANKSLHTIILQDARSEAQDTETSQPSFSTVLAWW